MTLRLGATIAVAAFVLAACSSETSAPLVASDVEVSAARGGMAMRAAYLRLRNNTGEAIRITSAGSPSYSSVEMHETVIENDVARMRPIASVLIEPDSEVVFERGGKHLMLMRPVGDAARQERIQLDFYDGENLLISVTARQESG